MALIAIYSIYGYNIRAPNLFKRKRGRCGLLTMTKKLVHYKRKEVYAIYCRDNKTLYYNKNANQHRSKLILIL